MSKLFLPLLSLLLILTFSCTQVQYRNAEYSLFEKEVDSVLALMTLEEKIGQMCQLSGEGELTGPPSGNRPYLGAVKNGQVGSLLNINGVEYTRNLQEITLNETRLGIPLLFGYDVIHGYRTIFPVPLGEAASWDLHLIEKSARIAAVEASAAGQHWTFAPMVDIARDPRWGRIMEGSGEDSYLGSLIAAARVKGFQGEDLSDPGTIAACAKHYAAYGAAEGGRDYNTTDMSVRTLKEVYLPPFEAAVNAGVATFMTAFNEISGIPASGNLYLRNILRKEWNFEGMVVSDWNSIGELIPHGIASDEKEAAYLGIQGGIDMDMQGGIYIDELVNLVQDGSIPEEMIDNAVRNILRLKFQLGLFEDPFRYCNEQREKDMLLTEEHRMAARDVARKSIVLLKNKNQTLPLSDNSRTIAVIGPLANDKENILGGWKGRGRAVDAISVLQGIRNAAPEGSKILYSGGCKIEGEDNSGFKDAVKIAKKANVVVLVVGESAAMSGEANNRAYLGLPGVQTQLVREICKSGRPVILILMNGRPLAIPEENELADAVLETWFLGTEAGNAISDVLFGDYNPSAKLTVSFPTTIGQIPVYYNHKNTGRPGILGENFNSKYMDAAIEPLYSFGYGLSYTRFNYSHLRLESDTLTMGEELLVTVKVKNTGKYIGEDVVQLYIRDRFASVTRPIKELKAFEKILLVPGEEKTVTFSITNEMLSFYGIHMNWGVEPGEFRVMVGTNSAEYLEEKFVFVR